MIPKSTLLSLLSRCLADGAIKPSEVQALLPKEKRKRHGECKVDKAIRVRVADLSEQYGLVADGMRIRAQRIQQSGKLVLYLYRGTTFAERGISQQFNGIDDVDDAAQRLLAQYMERLDQDS